MTAATIDITDKDGYNVMKYRVTFKDGNDHESM